MTAQYPPPYPDPEPPYDPTPPEPPRVAHRRRLERPRRRFSPWLISAVAAVLVAIVLVGAACLREDPEPRITSAGVPVVPATPEPAPVSPPASAAPSASPTAELPEGALSGDLPEDAQPYAVGVDVTSGRYLTAGPLVANGVIDGPEVIVVRPGDRLVVRGAKPLHRVGA